MILKNWILRSRLKIIIAKLCLMLLVKIKFGHLKAEIVNPKFPNESIETIMGTPTLGGKKGKA